MSVPNLSKEDRRRGLKKARLVRKKRASIKNSLKKREIDLKTLFTNKELYDGYIANMRIIDIVSSLPGNSRISAEKILRSLKISPSKKVGGLGRNQKKNFYQYFGIT